MVHYVLPLFARQGYPCHRPANTPLSPLFSGMVAGLGRKPWASLTRDVAVQKTSSNQLPTTQELPLTSVSPASSLAPCLSQGVGPRRCHVSMTSRQKSEPPGWGWGGLGQKNYTASRSAQNLIMVITETPRPGGPRLTGS